jgi:hypothetical protein
MSKVIQVRVADGELVSVDANRHAAFNACSDQFRRGLDASGENFKARDAQEALAFLVSQLAYTEQETFQKMYQPMQYLQLVPVSYSAGEWADSIRYEIYDYAGRGKRTSGKGKDVNLVEVAYADKSFPVMYGNIGYDYTAEELRRSAFLRKALNTTRLEAAIEGFQRHMNDVALNGESSSNLTGLFNNASVPTSNAPVGAWQTGPKTPTQILGDINTMIMNIWTNTAFNDFPTDIVMAPTAFAYIAITPVDPNYAGGKTILNWVKENNIAKTQNGIDLNFMPGYGLDTAGAGATRRMMGYVKNPMRLVMHIPLPLRFLAPQAVGLSVEVPGEYKYSGVEFRYPKSAYYMDGI